MISPLAVQLSVAVAVKVAGGVDPQAAFVISDGHDITGS